MSKQRVSTRTMAVIGMFSAVSFIAVLIGRIVPTVAGFLSYDPKDAVWSSPASSLAPWPAWPFP